MSEHDTLKIDLDLGLLNDQEGILRAAEAGDDMSCVLRFHLLLEKALTFFLDDHRQGEIACYTKTRANESYGPMLGLAVAFGLPVAMAATFRRVNEIRNEFAHGKVQDLSKTHIVELTKCVDRFREISPSFAPASRRFITVAKLHGEKKVRLGDADHRTDFALLAITFWSACCEWMMSRAIERRLPANSDPDVRTWLRNGALSGTGKGDA